jgi:hypothetical protein
MDWPFLAKIVIGAGDRGNFAGGNAVGVERRVCLGENPDAVVENVG